MTFSRRELLALLGTSAAAGAIAACGGGARKVAGPAVPADARAALREAVAAVRARWPSASGWLAVRERTSVVAGSDARGTARQVNATLVLRAAPASGAVIERASDDATPAAIVALGQELAALGPGGGRDVDFGSPQDHEAKIGRDPAKFATATWLAELDRTLARTEALGSSRIVWRSAHAIVDDERTWFVGDGRDVAQRAVRVQSGVTTIAWTGTRPMIGEVVTARAAGLEALRLDDDAIGMATGRALELLTPGEPPAGKTAVVLDPSVTAALIAAGAGEVLNAQTWLRPDLAARQKMGAVIAAPGVTIVDDPTAGGYGGFAVDDEGHTAAQTVLVDRGTLAAVLVHGRRRQGDGRLAPWPSDLVMSAGSASDDALLAAAGDGLRIEDADGAVVDPASWRVTVRARRARRFAGGKLTGHAWTDVEVRGTLPDLLGGVTAIGGTVGTRLASSGDDAPPASATAPAIATAAEVQPRRRA